MGLLCAERIIILLCIILNPELTLHIRDEAEVPVMGYSKPATEVGGFLLCNLAGKAKSGDRAKARSGLRFLYLSEERASLRGLVFVYYANIVLHTKYRT